MLTELSNCSLRKEIENLRRDLSRLHMELGYRGFFNRAIPQNVEMYEWKRSLFEWKKFRLQAFEAFAHAQFVVSKMECSAQFAFNTQRTYNQRPKRKWKKKQQQHTSTRAACLANNTNLVSITLNNNIKMETDNNKENCPPNQEKTASNSQAKADILKNIKAEKNDEDKDDKNSIAQSIADTLKNLKMEKDIEYEQNDVLIMNRNIDSDNVSQMVTETLNDLKVEVGNVFSRVVGEVSRKRKQSTAEKRQDKKARMQ